MLPGFLDKVLPEDETASAQKSATKTGFIHPVVEAAMAVLRNSIAFCERQRVVAVEGFQRLSNFIRCASLPDLDNPFVGGPVVPDARGAYPFVPWYADLEEPLELRIANFAVPEGVFQRTPPLRLVARFRATFDNKIEAHFAIPWT